MVAEYRAHMVSENLRMHDISHSFTLFLVKISRQSNAIALVFILLISLLTVTASPAQAFSNVNSFTFSSSTAHIEDVALCTNFKYTFDPNSNWGGPWNQVGYETCPSEALTTSKLPATLHYKLRIQSQAPELFQVSAVDAYLTDSKGMKIATSRWAPTPLVDLDGPVNINNARFYGAFSLPNATLFPEGSYFLTIQFWNVHWAKLNGPNTPEKPETFNAFSFKVAAGQTSAIQSANSANNTCKFDPGFNASRTKISATADAIFQQSNAITDFSASGVLENLKNWNESLKQDVLNLANLKEKADLTYGHMSSGVTCDDYLLFISEATATQAKIAQTQAVLVAYLAKAQKVSVSEPVKNSDSSFCQDQGNSALASIKSSNSILAKYESLVGKFDVQQKSALTILNDYSEAVNTELQNLKMWNVKIPAYQQQAADCKTFDTAFGWTEDLIGRYEILPRQIDAYKGKVKENPKVATTQDEEKFGDVDAEEEEPSATLTVSYNSSLARYIVKVESNLPGETLSVRATKKGSRTLKFSIDTDDDGIGGIRTKTKLAGYTLVLSFGSEKLDQVRVK
jgi:hypothetical protein